jgi:hypothetical protein
MTENPTQNPMPPVGNRLANHASLDAALKVVDEERRASHWHPCGGSGQPSGACPCPIRRSPGSKRGIEQGSGG